MQITYFIDGLEMGGTEKRLYELLLNLKKDNFKTNLSIITFDKKGYYYKKLLDKGFDVIVVEKRKEFFIKYN